MNFELQLKCKLDWYLAPGIVLSLLYINPQPRELGD